LSPDKLYAQAFVDYELSANRSTAPQKQGIEAAYQNKDFQKVITLSGASTALTPAEHFYAGLSYLHTNQFPAAITHLQTTASTNNTQKADAEYYLAMAHLKNHDYDKAIGLMEKINNDKTHPYNDQFSRQYIRKVKMLKWR
jgi:tetratricopeptide (TPR) repeat protein